MKEVSRRFKSLFVALLLLVTAIQWPVTSVQAEEAKEFDKTSVTLHYHRFDNNYDNWDVWCWPIPEGVENGFDFTDKDDFGVYTTIEAGALDAETSLGFIVRKGEWEAKDWEGDRFMDKAYMDENGHIEIWVVSGQEKFYYSEKEANAALEVLKEPRVTSAVMNTLKKINFTTNNPVVNTDASVVTLKDETGAKVELKDVVFAVGGASGLIFTKEELNLNHTYTLEIDGYIGGQVTYGEVFNSEDFEANYTYTGDLGAVYTKKKTTFTLWAPTASKVELALYGTDGKNLTTVEKTVDMVRGEKGSWTVTVDGDLHGTYYNYLVSIGDKVNTVVDPYAKAVGVNGKCGMVINLDTTDPDGWNKDKKPELKDATDTIIYEMHIRDFSISSTSGISLEYQGKYNGVWQPNTTIPGTDVKTGVAHLIELGVNTVHLLPSFDYASVDETKLDTPQFNWGYDPLNYNVPEGSYSSDPYTAEIRIEEFKQMVLELHKAGIRVVMDVVYNHTGPTLDSNLNLAVPNYYYRQNDKGAFSNGSGCGNETASERSMMGRLIYDSVLYWAEEYHIDGFRFDLMAIHDIDTITSIREGLNEIDETIIMYGEGWHAGGCALEEALQCTKANTVKYEDLQIAAFSDDIRDGIKGSVFDALGQGFVNGADGCEEKIKFGIVASTYHQQVNIKAWANQPYQTITYASAHDNNTLWDKLQISNADDSEEVRLAMNKMSAAIIYTSQGIPFILAGEEMARTKVNEDGSLNHNSYNASDAVNAMDWQRKIEYSDLFNYYKGLISLRKAHKAFHMNTSEQIQESIAFLETPANVVAYTLNGKAAKDSWNNMAVIFNANREEATVPIPEGQWVVVVNAEKAGVEELARIDGGKVVIPAQTSYVLVDANSFDNPNTNAGFSAGWIVGGVVGVVALAAIIALLAKKKK